MKTMRISLISGLFLLFATFSQVLSAQESADLKSMAEYNKTTFDFGKIKQNVPAKATFEITNTSMVPLILSNVKGSCGCTVPSYPKEPIKPGETAKILATYNARALGKFTKTVTVYSNAENSPKILTIKGEVLNATAFEALEKESE